MSFSGSTEGSYISSSSMNPMYDEHMIIEIEIHNWRGLIENVRTTPDEDAYYEASIQLVDAATGKIFPKHGIKYYRFPGDTRQRSFLSKRYSPDRFVFPVVIHANEFPAVRFDIYRKSLKRSGKRSLSPRNQNQSTKLIGVAEITPWLYQENEDEDERRHYRWIRLAHDANSLPGRTLQSKELQRQQKMLGRKKNKRFDEAQSPINGPRMRKEIQVLARTRHATGEEKIDLIQMADSKTQWFLGPPIPVSMSNVVRIACIRTDDSFLSQSATIAARLRTADDTDTDDVSEFFQVAKGSGYSVSKIGMTRPSTNGVWMQVLTVPIPSNADQSSLNLDLAILHAAKGVKRNIEHVLAGHILTPLAQLLNDEPVWLRIPPNARIKLAARLDYDEHRDVRESRPFFDSELESSAHEPSAADESVRTQLTAVPRQCHVARIVLARARKVRPLQRSSKPKTFGARVQIKGQNPRSGASQLTSVQPIVSTAGEIIWCEAFEFPLVYEDEPPECIVSIWDTDDPARQNGSISLQLSSDGTVSRNWYPLIGSAFGGELLVVTTCDEDPSVRQDDARWAVTEALSYAFPDLSLQTIERVFDTTNSVEEACVALSAIVNADKSPTNNVDREVLASANATNLNWMVSPLIEERTLEFNALVNGDEMKMDDEAAAQKKRDLKKNKQFHLSRSSSAVPLTKKETVDLIKIQGAETMTFTLSCPPLPDSSCGTSQQVVQSEVNYDSDEETQTIFLLASGRLQKDSDKKRLSKRPRMSVELKTTFDEIQEAAPQPAVARKVEMKVNRVPRDFATLRSGIVARLGTDKGVPQLPHWVVASLRIDKTARNRSLAAGVTTAGITAAVGLATAPISVPILVTVGGALTIFAALGTHNYNTYITLDKIQEEIETDTFLTDLVQAIVTFGKKASDQARMNDALTFVKQFVGYGAKCILFQPFRGRKSGSLNTCQGALDDLLESKEEDVEDGQCNPSPSPLSLSLCSYPDDDDIQSAFVNNSRPTSSALNSSRASSHNSVAR